MYDDLYEQPDNGPLTVIRLTPCPERGLKLCPITRPLYDVLTYKYSRTLLAEQLSDGTLRKWPLRLSEFDSPAECTALIYRPMAADFSSYVQYTTGYTYAGYGMGAAGFGYDDWTTVAWVHPHRDCPVVFWRKSDPIGEGRVMTWLNHHADDMEDGLLGDEYYQWPTVSPETKELQIPDELVATFPVRGGGRRRVGSY